MQSSKARYFPISQAPLKMAAGLHRFGADFGQGEADARFFQLDEERAHYLEHKRKAPRERHLLAGTDAAAQRAREGALVWLHETLAREAPAALAEARVDRLARDPFEAIGRAVQEDLAVLCADDDGAGRVVALDVRFPSGWRPERLGEASFQALHAPVPLFAKQAGAARSMVTAMVERGPYVRFVWTLASDARLDLHPERAPGATAWEQAASVFLRVERQITVPLPHVRASVFLIRVYCYPFHELTASEQALALWALEHMPPEIRAYKQLPTRATLEAALARMQLRSSA